MNINIAVPENCEAETVTVVYKFKAAPAESYTIGSSAAITAHIVKKWSCKTCGAEFDSPRSCGQHSRYCGSKSRKKSKYAAWTPEQIQYLIDNHGKLPAADIAAHLGKTKGQCWDKYYTLKKNGAKPAESTEDESTKAAGESAEAPPEAPIGDRWSTDIKEKPSFMESVKGVFSKKEFAAPADFDASKPFGVKSYVYHAPAREMGRVITVDMQRQTVLVDFNGTSKLFTLDAAKAMHKEMIARAK